jgi:hypothetical protein
MESILALQQTLDRLLEHNCNFSDIQFVNCKGEVDMAICILLKSNCQQLSIGHQCLPFTPALAEALAKSASLDKLVFAAAVTFDKAETERLALCLCENSSITTLRLGDAFQGDKGDESMVAFVKHLPGMWHLRHLTLEEGNEFGEAGERALVEVLEEGVHSLSKLTLEGKAPSLQNYINFLLWFKNIGGKRAISSCSRMKWIDLLSHFTNDEDPSTLYFTLRSDPGRFVSSVDLLAHFINDEDLSALYFTLRSDPGRFVNL